ncbi:glycosyltransferase [Cylindrospermum stagnale PCC 7417]|uniref:Glycosyltransferase n=1 Tax=Cylindrospermum stagnale PCC 7417 TaxID=56107 RepID=K9X5K6_9NOST|nr:glycosyltransferase [Cylindrospermum stagnale]AFZ27940.1 glycosyltransferase [Cylindrospermum stagnale PCC 7417]
MKILHIIPSVASVRGGPSQAIVETVKALRNQGVDTEIATTNDNGNDLLDVPLGKLIDYKQVPVRFFPRFSPKVNSIREFAFSSQLTRWLWQNISNYDLLHVHAIFSYASTAAMAIARFQGIPYIVRPLGQLSEWSLQQSARKKQIYLNLIERTNLSHSRALHLTSQQEQQEVYHLGLDAPSFVLPHGVSIPPPILNVRYLLRQHLNLPTDEPVILFLSRLHPKKGLEYLIPALGKLTHHRFTFVLAGSGSKEYVAEIESLLISTGIRSRTHFAGFVAGETKNLFLQGSDLFALTSHAENFGLSVLEALAVGVPVLLTSGVALASIVQQHQLGYIAELDVLAIASALEHYLSHPQETKEMCDRARQVVMENYTWERVAQEMIVVYEKIINSN